MIGTRKLALWAVVFGSLSILPLEAQPGGRGGRGGFGGGISPGQVFGLLAFDEKFNVTDEQLLALRDALKPLHGEQQQAMAEMFSGEVDWQSMRETMREMQMKMRSNVMAVLSETLEKEQIELLKTHMKEQQEQMRSRFGGRGRGPRGSGSDGGGSDGDGDSF